MGNRKYWIALVVSASANIALADAELFGVDFETGSLVKIALDGAVTDVGPTGLTDPDLVGGLEFGPDGSLYALTVGVGPPAIYRIDPNNASTELVGMTGLSFMYEGGLAIASDGRAWAAMAGSPSQPRLLSINMSTGAGVVLGALNENSLDLNGLSYRESDGMLIALARDNLLIQIDPVTLEISTIATLPFELGSVGGLTIVDGVGYLVTGNVNVGGTNELYSVDINSGATTWLGNLGTSLSAFGIGGLAGRTVDPPPPTCLGDLNHDGIVAIEDIAALLSSYSQSGENIPADLDNSGLVDIADLALMLSLYANVCDE